MKVEQIGVPNRLGEEYQRKKKDEFCGFGKTTRRMELPSIEMRKTKIE